MRGLNVRVQYALAQIAVLAGTPDAEEQLWDVVDQAHREGRCDFRNDVIDPPIMFSDVPELLNAWRCGQDEGVHDALGAYNGDDDDDLF